MSSCSTPAAARRKSRKCSAESWRRLFARSKSKIACGSDDYVPLLWEKALRYDWPVTLASGLPASLTRPGRALVAFSEWIESDFASGSLRRLLQSGDITLGDIDLTPGRAAGMLVKAKRRLGPGDLSSWRSDGCPRRYRLRADDVELPDDQRAAAKNRAEQADTLLAWVTSLLHGVPVADGGWAGRPAGPRRRHDELYRSATPRRRARIDRAAAAALKGAIAELKSLGAFRCTLAAGLRFIRERVDGLRVGAIAAGPAICSYPASHSLATPAGPTSSSSDSKKAACSRQPPKIQCCWMRSDSASARSCGCRAIGPKRPSSTLSIAWRRPARRVDLPQLLLPRSARVPPDLSVLADAAGASNRVRDASAFVSRSVDGISASPYRACPATPMPRIGESDWWLHGLKQARARPAAMLS